MASKGRPKYMIRYQGADGEVLSGGTVFDEEEVREAFAESAARQPDVTVTWCECRSVNEVASGQGAPNPWCALEDLPGAVASSTG